MWYKELDKPEQFVDDVAQVFLGQRLACAQCHHHPYEKWSQDDYWGLAAFFGRVGRKDVQMPSSDPNATDTTQVIVFTKSAGGVTNKRTGKTADIEAARRPADGRDADDDPRQKLADWMTDPKQPVLREGAWPTATGRTSSAAASWTRSTTCGSRTRRRTRNCSTPWRRTWSTTSTSLKSLVKTICKSRTYQLSAVPNDFNKHDKQNYARYYPKRMQAEVLLDAVNQVTDSAAAVQRPAEGQERPDAGDQAAGRVVHVYFLDVFGRPQRISACECERVNEANLAQALHLLNSDEVQGKITHGGRASDSRGRGQAAGRREGGGAVPVGVRPQADGGRPDGGPGPHRHGREEGRPGREADGLREHPVGAAEHEGVRVRAIRSVMEEEAFLRAISAAPADSVLRLVYADWLEEAEVIYVLNSFAARFECLKRHARTNHFLILKLVKKSSEANGLLHWVARLHPPVWCVVGTLIDVRIPAFGEESLRGTRLFRPTAKIYLATLDHRYAVTDTDRFRLKAFKFSAITEISPLGRAPGRKSIADRLVVETYSRSDRDGSPTSSWVARRLRLTSFSARQIVRYGIHPFILSSLPGRLLVAYLAAVR